MRRLLHHRPRRADGMTRPRNPGNRASLQIRSVHDGCVHLVLAFARKHRALAGVKQWIILEDMERGLNRVHRRPTLVQNGGTGMNRPIEPRTIRLVAIRCQRRLLNDARSAMHHNRPVMRRLLRISSRNSSRNQPHQHTHANRQSHLDDLPGNTPSPHESDLSIMV